MFLFVLELLYKIHAIVARESRHILPSAASKQGQPLPGNIKNENLLLDNRRINAAQSDNDVLIRTSGLELPTNMASRNSMDE